MTLPVSSEITAWSRILYVMSWRMPSIPMLKSPASASAVAGGGHRVRLVYWIGTP